MVDYLLQRLLLLPITLFGILLINFTLLNLAPKDPTQSVELGKGGGATRGEKSALFFGSSLRYLQFREHYGLTLPLFFNSWPSIDKQEFKDRLKYIAEPNEASKTKVDEERLLLGDQARYQMKALEEIAADQSEKRKIRSVANYLFRRGGTRQVRLGGDLTPNEREENRRIEASNLFLTALVFEEEDTEAALEKKINAMKLWHEEHRLQEMLEPNGWQRLHIFFFETRFFRYFKRVLALDFGTLRNDDNKQVIDEVLKRLKYSLTLSLTPLFIVFILSLFFGFLMAFYEKSALDHCLNLLFLLLYAIPIYVVVPFLIENVAIGGYFPFTTTKIPTHGFTSPTEVYEAMTSSERLFDILHHLYLPLIALIYGNLAAQARLCRTVALEVFRQDYIKMARAKGLTTREIFFRHVARNGAIPIITSVAGSLGAVLGGSLIVETLFEIDGFGRFFYEAVVNWDYNVVLFSSIAGSFLALIGYLIADIAYMKLDPRVDLRG